MTKAGLDMAQPDEARLLHAGQPAHQPSHFRLRRLERQLSLALLGIVGLYLILYAIGVLILQSHVNHMVAEQLGVARAFHLSTSAAPPGLALRANAIQFTTQQGEAGGADTATITLPVLMPWRAVTVLHDVAYNNQYLRVTLDSVTASAPLYARTLAQYHTEASGLKVWPPSTDAMAAPALENALQILGLTIDYQHRLGSHDAANPEEESTATLHSITLPAGGASGAPDAKAIVLDRLTLRTTAEPAVPRNMRDTAAVTAWRDAGGALNLAPFELDALGTNTLLHGPITLDQNLVPAGKLTLTFTGLDKAYAALKTFNLMPPAQYETLGNLLKLMPQGGAAPFDFPVTLKDHAIFFMNGAIFELNRMPWEVAAPVLPTDESAPDNQQPQVTPAPVIVAPAAAPTLPLTPADPALPLGEAK